MVKVILLKQKNYDLIPELITKDVKIAMADAALTELQNLSILSSRAFSFSESDSTSLVLAPSHMYSKYGEGFLRISATIMCKRGRDVGEITSGLMKTFILSRNARSVGNSNDSIVNNSGVASAGYAARDTYP